jgi:hypothetical protein
MLATQVKKCRTCLIASMKNWVVHMRVWKIGATLSALTSCSALIVQALFSSPVTSSLDVPKDTWSFEYFDARWLEPSPDCAINDSCVFVVITGTRSCPYGVVVHFTITDEKDQYIASQVQFIGSEHFVSGTAYEIGTDSENVAYFSIDDVTCGTQQDTTEHFV